MPRTKKRNAVWEGLSLGGSVVDSGEAARQVRQKQQMKLDLWGAHPLNWFYGTDLDDRRRIVWTKDEGQEAENAIQPYPDKPYLRAYINELYTNPPGVPILIDKSRQVMATWTTMLYIDWVCRFKQARRCLVSKHKEEESVELLEDKVRFMHRQLPEWVKTCLPMDDKPAKKVNYPLTGSYILGVAQNVAETSARGGQASIILIDEAARQSLFGDILQAAIPMATQIIALTTAEAGNPGAEEFKRLIDEGLE